MALIPSTETTMQCSKDVADDCIPHMELTRVFIEIRKCQMLSKRSNGSTFIGSTGEFYEAHDVMARVSRERPVQRQKQLVPHMRKLAAGVDDNLLIRCSDYADRMTEWSK